MFTIQIKHYKSHTVNNIMSFKISKNIIFCRIDCYIYLNYNGEIDFLRFN